VHRSWLAGHLEILLPLATDWATEQEKRVLDEGVALSKEEIADAITAGVQGPERVHVLRVDAIPSPTHPILKAASDAMNFLPTAPRGLTLGYGIFIRSDYGEDRHLLAHELAHTAQYERLGGILPFLRSYIFQCAMIGYHEAPLEQEADDIAERICGLDSARASRADAGALASVSLG
jgi:hypothetical protein